MNHAENKNIWSKMKDEAKNAQAENEGKIA